MSVIDYRHQMSRCTVHSLSIASMERMKLYLVNIDKGAEISDQHRLVEELLIVRESHFRGRCRRALQDITTKR